MDTDNLNIVCYTGGTCGDLISALIDSRDVNFNNSVIKHTSDREKLKKPHQFVSNLEKDNYLNSIKQIYRSIPSHDIAYHIDRGHKFIGVRVQNINVAIWAATRFKELHRQHVWEEMAKSCGATTIENYSQMLIHFGNLVADHTDKIIMLEDIVSGNVLTNLEKFIKLDDNAEQIYQQWLKVNKCPNVQS